MDVLRLPAGVSARPLAVIHDPIQLTGEATDLQGSTYADINQQPFMSGAS